MTRGFTVYALSRADPRLDTEAEAATLDEALTHLRELILIELEDAHPGGPFFSHYGITIDEG